MQWPASSLIRQSSNKDLTVCPVDIEFLIENTEMMKDYP